MRKRALLIANRKSGKGSTQLEPVRRTLESNRIMVDLARPDTPSEIPDLIRRKGQKADLIIIAGGDGTINGAAPALLEAARPVGIVPLGTANDLARTLEIPGEPEEAARVIIGGHTRSIDVGLVNGRPFFNVANIGFGAQVARFHRGQRKQRLGLLSYPLSWVEAYRTHRPFTARIICDTERHASFCSLIAVGNGPYYGGGMTVSEDARIDDGRLDLYFVKPVGFWGLLAMLPNFMTGRLHRSESAVTLSGRSIEIRTRRPQPITIDGEPAEKTPADFTVLPMALNVFCPPAGDRQVRDPSQT